MEPLQQFLNQLNELLGKYGLMIVKKPEPDVVTDVKPESKPKTPFERKKERLANMLKKKHK